MANYTAADIKALREQTGAGMLDVKKALDEAQGDHDKALEIIRVKGLKGISKREGRAATEGLVALHVEDSDEGQTGTMVEVNCETDFVAKNDKFISFADKVLKAAVASGAEDVDALLAAPAGEGTVKDEVDTLAAAIGEKIEIRRVARLTGATIDAYAHHTAKDLPPSVGVLVAADEKGAEVAHDVALHVAAYSPRFLSREDVPAEDVERERHVLEETTRAEGKPEQALAKIVEGRMNGFYKDNVLLDQPFAKDPKVTVGQVVDKTGGKITGFVRFRVGN